MNLIYDAGLNMKQRAELFGDIDAAKTWASRYGDVFRMHDGRKVVYRPKKGSEFLVYAISGITSTFYYNGFERMKENVRPIRYRR